MPNELNAQELRELLTREVRGTLLISKPHLRCPSDIETEAIIDVILPLIQRQCAERDKEVAAAAEEAAVEDCCKHVCPYCLLGTGKIQLSEKGIWLHVFDDRSTPCQADLIRVNRQQKGVLARAIERAKREVADSIKRNFYENEKTMTSHEAFAQAICDAEYEIRALASQGDAPESEKVK